MLLRGEMRTMRRAVAGSKGGQKGSGKASATKSSDAGKEKALHGARIEDYALIGDCETAALVSREGSIDWLCWPTFSSGACFAALLGTRDHGFWKIAPKGKVRENRRQYRKGTLIIETVFVTREGEVCVTDFMPPRGSHSKLVRIVRGERGRVAMTMELALRFDYGRTVPWVTSAETKDGCALHAVAGPSMVVLHTQAPLRGEDHTTTSEFTVKAGETVTFTLTYCSSLEKVPKPDDPEALLVQTERFWTGWLKKSVYRGEYQDVVARSLMTLKAMSYKPSGGIVAAVTTSLPEEYGGARNWDYRYCWLRDTSFTLLVLLRAGYEEEALAWRRWLLRAVAGSPDQVQTLYDIHGGRNLVEWLPGYADSKPVRIGNGAAGQFQMDVFGEVASALARMPRAEDDIRMPALDVQVELANHLCEVWMLPDEGIWEIRGKPMHFVHSKVMAWVALDRTIQLLEAGGGNEAGAAKRRERERYMRRWKKVRAQIHREVCEKGFNRKLNSFVQAYGRGKKAGVLDASCLRIGMVGFLPMDDPRIIGTIDAIERGLMSDGLVMRYRPDQMDDGLKGSEGQFLACSFWLVVSLWLIGRKAEEANGGEFSAGAFSYCPVACGVYALRRVEPSTAAGRAVVLCADGVQPDAPARALSQ
jgi:GH15 family glucan-1,4-alpha-glucosidase